MFVLTEHTPNPEALKFIPDVRLVKDGAWSFERGGEELERSPLAERLFDIEGVRRVFIAPEFLTVLRDPQGPGWDSLRYEVISAIADHLESGAPAVAAEPPASDDTAEDEIVADIRQVLGLYVRPGVARDGGDVLFDRFDPATGVLWIRMQGACGGCPSSRRTLKSGVERIVRQYVPEVLRVEEAPPADAAEPQPSRLRQWIEASPKGPGGAARTIFSHNGREIASRTGAGPSA